MDIDLLSKMVAELIQDNDEVALPGVGSFIAEFVPSSFSDKGYTINPPYRRLSFRQRESSDTKLIDFYARKNHLDTRTATSILTKFLLEMSEILKAKKTIVFPGLGRLRATRENNFFFVPDEDLNIYPEGFGLEPVSLKTHVETEDEVQAAVESLQSIIGPVAEPAGEPEAVPVAEPEPEIISEPAPVTEPEGKSESVQASEPEPVVGLATVEELEPEPVPSLAPEPAVEPETTEPTEEPSPIEEPASEPTPEPAVVKEPDKVQPSAVEAPVWNKAQPKRRLSSAWNAVIFAVAAVILLFVLFIIVSRIAPGFIDKLLYNQEELELIRTFQL